MHLPHRFVLLLTFFGWNASGQQWTEQEILARFQEQNPLARDSRARIAMSEAEYRGRTRLTNPSVSVTHEGAGRTDFYQASQSLPVSGRLGLLRQAGAAQTRVLASEGEFSLWQARSDLRAAIYGMLSGQLRKEAFESSIRQMDGVIEKLKSREQEGESSKLDRMRAEQERADWIAQSSAMEAALSLSRGEVLAFLPAAAQFETVRGQLEPGASLPPVAELQRLAQANRGDLEAERLRLEMLRLEQRAADRLKIPEPVVTAGLKRADLRSSGLSNGPVVGVGMAIPLFNKGKAEVARYSAEQERTAARIQILSRRLEAAVEAAARAVEIRQQALARYKATVEGDAGRLLEIARIAYEEGEIGILQLLDAYRVQHQTKLRRIDLEAEARQARIQLEFLVGQELTQ